MTASRTLRLVHHHPGRIRMRADAFRDADGADGKDGAASRVVAALEAVRGVASVTHNARTGSMLVAYAPGLVEPDTILETAAEAAGLDEIVDEKLAPRPPADPAGAVIDAVRGLDRATRELTGGRADLPLLVPTALAGLAVYSFVKDANGPRMPRWDNLAWWAYSVFVDWQRTSRAREDREREETASR